MLEHDTENVSLIAFLNVFMHLKLDFAEDVLKTLFDDSNSSNLIKKSIKMIGNSAYTQQLIQFYSFLLKVNYGKYQYFRPDMVLEIQEYALKVLNSLQSELFCSAILLIN